MPYGRGVFPPKGFSLKSILTELPKVLADAAKLKEKAVAASVVATIVAVVSPFGLNVGPDGAIITGILVAVGTVAAAIERVLA